MAEQVSSVNIDRCFDIAKKSRTESAEKQLYWPDNGLFVVGHHQRRDGREYAAGGAGIAESQSTKPTDLSISSDP